MEKVQVPFVVKEEGCEISKKVLEKVLFSSESIGNELKEFDEFEHSKNAPNNGTQSGAAELRR